MVYLLLVSCNAIKVNYDYDKEADFSNYTTYNYYADMDTGLSELDTKRLLRSIEIVLRTKGLQLSEESDFLINIQSRTFQPPHGNTVGVGVGGTGRSVGGGVTIGIPIGKSKLERQIQFDFVDRVKDAVFWEATSSISFKENISLLVKEERIQELVEKVFAEYPPK